MKVTLRRKCETGVVETKVKLVRKPKIPINPEQVELLASRGLTQGQICDCLGINVQTMLNRKKENSEITEAIKRGKAKGIKAVTNALFEQATKGGNVAAAIFWLKNNAGWRDKIDIEMEYALPAPLVIEIPCIDVTPEHPPELGDKGNQS